MTGRSRVDDRELVERESTLASLIDEAGIELIGYRELRQVQRGG